MDVFCDAAKPSAYAATAVVPVYAPHCLVEGLLRKLFRQIYRPGSGQQKSEDHVRILSVYAVEISQRFHLLLNLNIYAGNG